MWKPLSEAKFYELPDGYEERFKAFYDAPSQHWMIVDYCRFDLKNQDPGEDVPDKALLRIPVQATHILLEAVADTDMIDSVLADRTYAKEVEDRHLDIIETLVEATTDEEE